MSDINITIPLPVLAAGQYFKVRYRRGDPVGAWTNLANQSNAAFTITGLTPGTYQLSAILVRSADPLVECEEVLQYFEVVQAELCGEFSFAILVNEDATLYQLQISIGAMPVVPPCGGYDVVYGIVGGMMSTVNYANITGTILLPASNVAYHVEVRAIDCAGNYIICDSEDVNPPEGSCTHATVTNAEIYGDVTGWHVKLTVTQSLPPTNPFAVAYSQVNIFPPGSPGNDPGGMISLAATPVTTVLTFPVTPQFGFNPTLVAGHWIPVLKYSGTIADRCRWSTKWAASLELT